MGRQALRLTAVLVATASLGSTLGSASPPRLAAADAIQIPLVAAVASDQPDPRPARVHLTIHRRHRRRRP